MKLDKLFICQAFFLYRNRKSEMKMEQTQLPNWLKKRAEVTPNRIALIVRDESYTFGQLYAYSLEYSRKFNQFGIRKGNKVGLLLSNRFEMVVAIHAIMNIGGELILFNTRLSSNELSWQFQDSELDFLLSEEKYGDMIQEMNSAKVIFVENVPSLLENDEFVAVEEFTLNQIATIMYTSGTSGFPKAVEQSYGNHWYSAVGSMLNLGLQENDRWLCTMPLFHISGLSIILRGVIYGMTVILHEQFQEERVNRDIVKYEVTIVSVVTTMLNRLLEQMKEKEYPSSLRCMLLGGGPAPLPLLEKCREKDIPVYQTYGMTETASQIVTLSPEYSIEKLGSAGKALFSAQIMIHYDGREAKANEIGEILVKGPNVTKGYRNRKAETELAFENGWFKTGDMGYLDEEGFLYVVDRRSDLIISGGENIYPAEIEAILMKHEAVFEAGVTGCADDKWGEVPVAFAVLQNNVLEKDELINFCKKYLASYKVPRDIYFVEELPRNSANKLLRRDLKKLIRKD